MGVREERTEHTIFFPRSFIGSGLTWHPKVHFSTFDGKLETHFITKHLQIGPRASRFVLDFSSKLGSHLRNYQINSFSKNISFDSSWDGTLAFKNIRRPIWRPEDQFGGIWWWSHFPIMSQIMQIKDLSIFRDRKLRARVPTKCAPFYRTLLSCQKPPQLQ